MEFDPTERAGKYLLEEIATLPEKDFRKVNMAGVMSVIAMEVVAREARASAEAIKARNDQTDPRD
jgi:hypothetical protein